LPDTESKKFRYAVSKSRKDWISGSTPTDESHARSAVFFAVVITSFWRSALFGYGKPPFRASFRAARASLYTTRAHPNVRASAAR
jgi:hypothetical protein